MHCVGESSEWSAKVAEDKHYREAKCAYQESVLRLLLQLRGTAVLERVCVCAYLVGIGALCIVHWNLWNPNITR